MTRREFIALLGSSLVSWPANGKAQQTTLPVVGFLNSASADGYASMASAFRQGLKEAGFAVGENVLLEYRWADDKYDRLPALAADLVNRRVTVIFANSPSIAPAKAATSTVPIVFMSGDDPVRLGFVTSLNRPGGTMTGVAIRSGELASKRLGVLHELIPHAKTVGVLINSDFGPSGSFQTDVEAAARVRGLVLRFLQANNQGEIDAAFTSLAQSRADALLVGPDHS